MCKPIYKSRYKSIYGSVYTSLKKQKINLRLFENINSNQSQTKSIEQPCNFIDYNQSTMLREHANYQPRLHPGRDKWDVAISLMSMVHRPDKAGCRLCPACLSETPAVLSLCLHCKGYLISHGWKKRIKITVANLD